MEGDIVISPIVDRLRVFVSSTIRECSAERAVVRGAIRSINHDPILFEDIGARPHPPRELYTARLEMSQIFVGVYRESYGWIAPDMDISGVEDEFRIAANRGMDRLIYVYQTPTARDPKLEALIETAKNAGLTVATYSEPEQLRDLVRDNVTAVVSNRFVDQAVASREAPKPDEVLDSLLPNRAHRFRRPNVETRIIEALRDSSRLMVAAPLGGGKTVLLAQLATENDWIFVDGQGLSRLDLLARAANAVRARLGQRPITLTTEQSATKELLSGWEALGNTTLAVDGAGEPVVLWELPAKNYRLVLTSRAPLEVFSQQRFDLPPLTRDEIETWVTALRGTRPDSVELSSLVARSGGNPLYLRFYALGGSPSADLSLRELEVRAVQALPARAKEITSYLAISNRPLSLGDLETLVGSEDGPEGVAEQIAAASSLVRQTRGRAQLVHEHLRGTLLDQLHHAPARLAFFASRLGHYFEQSERYVAAFHAYLEAGERRHADRLLDQAANQATLIGGGAPAIPIFRRQVELAHEMGQFDKEVYALLNLAYALKQTGASGDAGRELVNARLAAVRQNDQAQLLRVKEMEVVLDLAGRPRDERIRDLAALRKSYADAGDAFNAARVATSLAAEYIAGREYVSAEATSREALDVFLGVGDEFGIRVARLNIAAALSGITGREHEAAAIAHELQQDLDPEEYPRERAVLCNFLTHHYRQLGDTARASEFALEAIQIGEQLEDLHVISINRTNLGNVRRDEGALDQALDQYRAAEQAAVAGGLREGEAAANELIASVLNEREQYGLAMQHALHATKVARLVGDHVLIARAEEERAVSLKGQRDFDGAIDAYVDAVKAIAVSRSGGSFLVSLVGDALNLCATSRRIDLKIHLLSGIFAPDLRPIEGADTIDPLQALYAALPPMARMIRVDRLLPIIALSMADLLASVPRVIERRIVLQAINALVDSQPEVPPDSALAGVAAILMAHSGNCLTLGDLVDIGEKLTRVSPRVYFKPQSDGAAHWTVRLRIGDGVIVTLTQLDDSPRIAATTMILTLLLASLDEIIRRRLLDAERVPRHEAIINLASRKELEEQLGPTLLNLGELPAGFGIFESTDVTHSDQPPIVVVCADDFGLPWRPNEHAVSDPHLLLSELLRVLVTHLLASAVEPEVLFPKIGGLIRRIGYQGSADHTHPRATRPR
jgi:tetratricopeptide (TPR) repeat protein